MAAKEETKKAKKKRVEHHPAVKCGQCGFHIRGDKHAEGTHHQIGKGGHAEIS